MRAIILLSLSWSLAVSARNPEPILGPESNVETTGTDAQRATPVEPPPVLSLKGAEKARALRFTLRGAWTSRGYRLSSQALNGNFPGAGGYEVDAQIDHEVSTHRRLLGAFTYGQSRFTNISGFGSSPVTAWQAALHYGWLVSGETSPHTSAWWFDLGYQVKKRGAVSSGTVTPMTDLVYHGPRAGLVYEGPRRWGGFGYNFWTYAMVPIFFREEVQTTGSYRFGLSTESGLMLRYELRDTLTIAVGAKLTLDYRSYFGTGSRGSVNATEIETLLSVPLEIQLRF